MLYRPGVGFERVAPKTKRSIRTLRLPDIAQAAIREQVVGRRRNDFGLAVDGTTMDSCSRVSVGPAVHCPERPSAMRCIVYVRRLACRVSGSMTCGISTPRCSVRHP